MALTSVADGGRSSWFLSEIRAAELSALRSVDDRQCCYLCFRSPGAQQQTHKHMQSLESKSLNSVFHKKKKTHRKYLGNIKSLNCIQFWVAAQTPGVCNSSQSLPLWQGTLRCRYQCTKPKKYTSCLPKFPPNLIFMQNKTQISPSLHATMGKPFFFVI